MDWLTKIWNSIKTTFTGGESTPVKQKTSVKQPIFHGTKRTTHHNEITMMSEISDEQIRINSIRSKYITTVKNPPYKMKQGDSIDKIAQKFGVETLSILAYNGLDEKSAKTLKAGQVLRIPPSRKIKNVKNLNDIAKSMGVSLDFVKRLKKLEDKGLPENKFHNTPYTDNAGVPTIGIGHALKKGDPKQLSNAQVCELCAKDLLKVEENLSAKLGQKNYAKMPQSMKEALLDMAFNKGVDVLDKTSGMVYCLKTGKYEAAINKMTYNKSSATGKEMSGLSKRRLFDISVATRMYKGKIPQSNINTAQQVYNRGIELLRQECKAKGLNFENMLTGYNKDVQSYFGNRLKLITKCWFVLVENFDLGIKPIVGTLRFSHTTR